MNREEITKEFLSAILPDKGYYCSVGLPKGKAGFPKSFFHDTLDGLVGSVLEISDQNYNAYYACATFHTKGSRKISNAAYLKDIFLDIDCGVGKQYETKKEGLAGLHKFMARYPQLKQPRIIDSGGGLHVHWILAEAVTKEVWKPVVENIKQACADAKFYADAAVTADVSRILRPVGTHNYKRDIPEVVVTLQKETAVMTLEEVNSIFGGDAISEARGVLAEVPDYITVAPSPLMESLKKDRQNVFTKILTAGCAHIDYLMNNQAIAEEPHWRGGLSIARNCVDWETAIHAISNQHPAYSSGETSTKADVLFDKPYLCVTMDKFKLGLCDNCVHKGSIKSPILLGAEIIKAEAPNEIRSVQTLAGPEIKYDFPKLPFPYYWTPSGAIYRTAREEEEGEGGGEVQEDIRIYKNPFYLVKRMSDATRGELVLARVHPERDKVKEFVIPLTTMTSKEEVRKLLAANGIIVLGKSLENMMYYLVACAQQDQKNLDLEVLYTQMGWMDDDTKFIIGMQEVNATEIKYSPPSEITAAVAANLHPKGSLEESIRVISKYADTGYEGHAYATLCAGFGAPLMKFTSYSGAMISLISSESGTGKTTILKVANSIWGHPSKNILQEGDTEAFKTQRIGVLNNLPPMFDEMTNANADGVSKRVYGVSGGIGTGRMQSQANIERKNDTTWSTIAVTTSNASLIDKIAAKKSAANGETMRVIEYNLGLVGDMDRASAYELWDKTMMGNYGLIGPLYIQHIIANLPKTINRLQEVQQYIDRKANTDSQYRFYSATTACGIVAGEVAYELGLSAIKPKLILEWTLDHLFPALKADAHKATASHTDALGEFMNQNFDSTLIIKSTADLRAGMQEEGYTNFRQMLPRRQLLIRIEPDTRDVYVSAKAFKEFCVERQIMYKELLRGYEKSGAYRGEIKKRMGKGTELDYPAVSVYVFNYNAGADFWGVEGLLEAWNHGTVTSL